MASHLIRAATPSGFLASVALGANAVPRIPRLLLLSGPGAGEMWKEDLSYSNVGVVSDGPISENSDATLFRLDRSGAPSWYKFLMSPLSGRKK